MQYNKMFARTAISAAILVPASLALAQSGSGKLEETVVTAERRVSTVQDTAAAITAISGESLERLGVAAPEDLMKTTPGLYANTAGANQMQFYIRGVGNFAANTFAEGAVAFSLDGVYLSRSSTYAGLFFDLDRVEVLKGPQGTLYGRNATGGAINLLTTRPEIGGEFGGYVRGELGNENHVLVNAAANIPVSDTFALRAAAQVLDHDGYMADGTGDAGSWSGRLSSLYEPNDRLSLQLIVDYQNVDDKGSGGTIVGPNPAFKGDYIGSDAWDVGPTSPEANALLVANSGFISRSPLGDPKPSNEVETTGVIAQLDWELDIGTLTALGAYRDSSYNYINYTPGFLLDVDEDADQSSLEVRLASKADGGLEWVVGAYYFDEDITTDSFFLQQANYPGANPLENSTRLGPKLNTETWAVFGQLTVPVGDQLRLVAGLRYTDEQKTMDGDVSSDPIFSGPVVVEYPLVGDESWTDTTWKAGVEYDLSDDSMLYANVATGFKAGGFYAEQAQYGNSYDPEELIAYSIGSKNRFMDDSLQLNAEAFYWDYTDHQESHLVDGAGGYNLFITENIGTAEIWGLDLESEFLPTARDRISLQLQYLHNEFTEFQYETFAVGPPNVGCPTTLKEGNTYLVNCDGFDGIRSPEWAGTLGYQHIFAVGEGELVLDLRAQYTDSTYNAIEYLEEQLQDSYTWYDASLTWYSAGDRYSLGLWGRNLTEEEVSTNGFISPFTTLVYGPVRPPRTYGVSFAMNF